MPFRSLDVTANIRIKNVTCPGTWLKNRDDVSIAVRLFNRTKFTYPSLPIFPLIFNEQLQFEKIFTNCRDPSQLAEVLEEEEISIQLIQGGNHYRPGIVLAYCEMTTRDFLFPHNTYISSRSNTRTVLLDRTKHFKGISPQLEFSTETTMKEVAWPTYSEQLKSDTSVDSTDIEVADILNKTKSLSLSKNRPQSPYVSRTYTPSTRRHYRSSTAPLSSTLRSPLKSNISSNRRYQSKRKPFVVGKANEKLLEQRSFTSTTPAYRSSSPIDRKLASTPTAVGKQRIGRSALSDPVTKYRSRSLSPVLDHSRLSRWESRQDRHSVSKRIHNKVKRIMEELDIETDTTDTDTDTLDILRDTIEDSKLENDYNNRRLADFLKLDTDSPIAYTYLSLAIQLDDDDYWNDRHTEYSALRKHQARLRFDEALNRVYSKLYH
ncbi:Spermatogenesis associated 6-like protein [Trichoplax sp. H2]|nr:Spermatogenesis associated 6-like protein [Trichoplax sp. H2]|eukprot:RDD41480.1 Spermatogenesis associated 6-like protein [Trichoplax sp. H2]